MTICFIHTVLKEINAMEIVNNISNLYCRVCVPNVIRNITAKVFDLM